MFRINDYIVCLNTPEDDSAFPKNYIFQQRTDSSYLQVELDAKGICNRWGLIDYNKNKPYSNWRYATYDEINEYIIRGKPYDVTILNNKIVKEENYEYLVPILNKLLVI